MVQQLAIGDSAPTIRTDQSRPVGDSQFQQLLETLPNAAYTCDREGLITYFNPAAARLWGRSPRLNDSVDRYCGSYRLYAFDGTPIPHDQCWMALALRRNLPYLGQEIIVERPNHVRINALAYANPTHDTLGRLNGAVNVLIDVSQSQRLESESQRYKSDLEQAVRDRLAQVEVIIAELQQSLHEIKSLFGTAMVCSYCARVLNHTGLWQPLPADAPAASDALMQPTVCPDCMHQHYGVISSSGDTDVD